MASISDLNRRNSEFYGDKETKNWQADTWLKPDDAEEAGFSSAFKTNSGSKTMFPEVLFKDLKSSGEEMGHGQDPHSYLEPKEEFFSNSNSNSVKMSPHDKPNSLSGYEHPTVPGTFSQQRDSLKEINDRNKEYWKSHVEFNGEPSELDSDYFKEGPRVQPESFGKT